MLYFLGFSFLILVLAAVFLVLTVALRASFSRQAMNRVVELVEEQEQIFTAAWLFIDGEESIEQRLLLVDERADPAEALLPLLASRPRLVRGPTFSDPVSASRWIDDKMVQIRDTVTDGWGSGDSLVGILYAGYSPMGPLQAMLGIGKQLPNDWLRFGLVRSQVGIKRNWFTRRWPWTIATGMLLGASAAVGYVAISSDPLASKKASRMTLPAVAASRVLPPAAAFFADGPPVAAAPPRNSNGPTVTSVPPPLKHTRNGSNVKSVQRPTQAAHK